MKVSRFRVSIPAAIAASSAALVVLGQFIACGGDDAGSKFVPQDASPTDSTTATDASSTSDANEDAMGLPPADAGTPPDAADASDSATCGVAVPMESQFFSTLATSLCESLKGCCNTGPSFDTSTCLSIYGNPTFGGFLGVGYAVAYLDGGRIAYDPSAACRCLEAVSSISCGLLSQAEVVSIQQTCLAAIHGTVAIAAAPDAGDAGDASALGCASPYECVSGYCTVNYPTDPADASLGICLPLVPDGGACSNQTQCSYLANGSPSLQCSGSTCVPRNASGTTCSSNSQCASGVCQQGVDGGAPTCVSGEVVSSASTCAFLTIPDGGDGG